MRVGLIQQKFHQTKELTISKTIEMIRESKSKRADLVVLQELHTSEYFCQSENCDFFDLADSYESEIDTFSKVAKELDIVLVTSLFEKRAVGLYHNSAIVFERDGSIAGKYRKMHIPDDPGFYEKFYFCEGDLGFEPISTSLGKLGVLICWDQWYPEAARLMALAGAEVLIYPTAIGWFDEDSQDEKDRQLDSWITVQRAHSIANGVPTISVNRVGFERDVSGVLDGVRFWGNSFISGPQGEFLYRASSDKEESVVVDIDMKRSEEVRRIWPFLRDRRIDSYGDITKRYRD
jgi:N-carbamoylputrescine amidase